RVEEAERQVALISRKLELRDVELGKLAEKVSVIQQKVQKEVLVPLVDGGGLTAFSTTDPPFSAKGKPYTSAVENLVNTISSAIALSDPDPSPPSAAF